MFNDILYFINEEERNFLKKILIEKNMETITICKKMETSKDSFSEKIIIDHFYSNDKIVIEKKSGFFDRLVIDRPYEVSLERL